MNKKTNLTLDNIIDYKFVLYGFLFVFVFFRAILMVHGGSQSRGQIRDTASGLCHSLSKARSNPCL